MESQGKSPKLTRQDFIKLGGIFVSALLPLTNISFLKILKDYDDRSSLLSNLDPSLDPRKLIEALSPGQQGRVLNSSIDIYDIPSFSGKLVNSYWRDWIVPIVGITIGASQESFNAVWYRIGDEGYAHSGSLQPVQTRTNPVVDEIPSDGAIAEVTVPFTDARWDPGEDKPVAYRFYYATTYWITELVRDEVGNPWYGVLDDKWEYMFYVPAEHLRIIPHDELRTLSADVPSDKKRIEVHLPAQVIVAYEYDQPVFMARVATGAIFSNGDFTTPSGRYMTFHKRSSRHMARGNLAANGYDLPGVPWNCYITEEGIAFHGTYWHNNFGRPRSHGCINITPQAAKWVFLWTMPTVPPEKVGVYKDTGTTVDIIA